VSFTITFASIGGTFLPARHFSRISYPPIQVKALLEELERKATIAPSKKAKKRTGRNGETEKRKVEAEVGSLFLNSLAGCAVRTTKTVHEMPPTGWLLITNS